MLTVNISNEGGAALHLGHTAAMEAGDLGRGTADSPPSMLLPTGIAAASSPGGRSTVSRAAAVAQLDVKGSSTHHTSEHKDLHEEIKEAIARMQADLASKAATTPAHLQVRSGWALSSFDLVGRSEGRQSLHC